MSKVQFENNLKIQELVKEKGANRENYSDEELRFINQFVGFGGMAKFGAKEDKTLLFEYFTPIEIVEKIMGLAKKHGFKQGGRVLEPSCGTGRFLHYLSPDSEVLGYEISKTSHAIATLNFPNFVIKNQYFNEHFVDRRGNRKAFKPEFDLVVGNPPYGDFKGKFTASEKKLLKIDKYVDYFVYRGLSVLKKGGLLIYIIPSSFINAEMDAVKESIYDLAKLEEAYRLPMKAFDHTDIQTDIVVFRKR